MYPFFNLNVKKIHLYTQGKKSYFCISASRKKQKITRKHNVGSTVCVQINKNMKHAFFSFPYQAAPFSAFPSYPCKSQRVFLRGVYRLGIMKSLRESEAAGVNTRQGILSISHHEPCCLCSLFLRLSP